MNGILNTDNSSKRIIDFLLTNDDYFINILDKFNHNFKKFPDNIHYTFLDDKNELGSILIYTKDGHYYPYVSNKNINNVVNILNSDFLSIFSIYSLENISEELLLNVKYPPRLKVHYNVMSMQRKDFKPETIAVDDFYCRRCNEKDYKSLKNLQFLYHKEEVYTDNSYYPYISEMQAFKHSLKNRINFAVFTKEGKDIPVSKASVNGESQSSYQLGGIFTKKEHRNKGLSQLCMNYLIEEIFKNKNINKIVLYVKRDNIPANKLYIKLGFKNIFNTVLSYF